MKSSRLQGEQIGFFFLVCPAEMAERKLDAVSSNFPGHREAATCTDLALSQKLSLFLHRHEQSVVRRETGHSFVQFFAINIPKRQVGVFEDFPAPSRSINVLLSPCIRGRDMLEGKRRADAATAALNDR